MKRTSSRWRSSSPSRRVRSRRAGGSRHGLGPRPRDGGREGGRGVIEMITGFIEFPGSIYAESRDDGLASGLTIGFAKGIGMIQLRTLVASTSS